MPNMHGHNCNHITVHVDIVPFGHSFMILLKKVYSTPMIHCEQDFVYGVLKLIIHRPHNVVL